MSSFHLRPRLPAEHPRIRWVHRDSCRRSAEPRTCHTRQRLDGTRATQRYSQTDQRSWRLSSEQPGPRDEARSEPACLGLPSGTSSPASPATANNEECQKTAQAETNARSAVRSVAQLPTLTRRLQMEVSCSMWSRSTEVRCCLQTVWDSCVGVIARPASSVALSEHSGVAGATTAGATLLSTNFVWGHLPGQTTARASETSSELVASTPRRYSGRQPASELPCPGRRSDRRRQAAAFRASPGRWHSRGAWSLDLRLGQKRCRLLLAEIPEGVDRKLRAETATSPVGIGTNQRSDPPSPGSAKLWAASQNSKKGAATDRRTAREASFPSAKPWRDRSVAPRRALQTAAGTGPQPSSPEARARPTSAECAEAARTTWGGNWRRAR